MGVEQATKNPTIRYLIEHLRQYGFGLQDVEQSIDSQLKQLDDRGAYQAGKPIERWEVDIIALPTNPIHVHAADPRAPRGSLARVLEDAMHGALEAEDLTQAEVRSGGVDLSDIPIPKLAKTQLDPEHAALITHLNLTRKVGKLPAFKLSWLLIRHQAPEPIRRKPLWT